MLLDHRDTQHAKPTPYIETRKIQSLLSLYLFNARKSTLDIPRVSADNTVSMYIGDNPDFFFHFYCVAEHIEYSTRIYLLVLQFSVFSLA